MKEITRIHIAKTPYDIEVDAKKELEKYNKQLEVFVQDPDVMLDVEVRMTELLEEHGVKPGGVIAVGDVMAVRKKLGEPHEFASDDDDAMTGKASVSAPRRLYRDPATAVLGGVLGGIAKFFGINPLWTRLGFLLILLASFGAAAIVYLVLWVVVPSARTAAEKLQLEGRPVTLANMKELREQTGEVLSSSRAADIVASVGAYGLGTLAAIGALGALILTVLASTTSLLGGTLISALEQAISEPWLVWTSYSLLSASGLLLTALGALIAYACFSRRMSKRIGITMITIVVAGVMAFGLGVGSVLYGSRMRDDQIESLRQTTSVDLPADFAQVGRLTVSAHSGLNEQGQRIDFTIRYVVIPTDTPRYTLTALPGTKAPQIVVDGNQARVILKESATQRYHGGHGLPQLTIYGPALDELTSEQGEVYYTALHQAKQDKLTLRPAAATTINLSGAFGNVQVIGDGSVEAAFSTVHSLTVVTMTGGSVTAGVIERLTVTQPVVCPAYSSDDGAQGRVIVRSVVSGEMIHNGKLVPAKSYDSLCGAVQIGARDDA